MADALASGASTRKGVGVQVPPRAQIDPSPELGFLVLRAFFSSFVVRVGAAMRRPHVPQT